MSDDYSLQSNPTGFPNASNYSGTSFAPRDISNGTESQATDASSPAPLTGTVSDWLSQYKGREQHENYGHYYLPDPEYVGLVEDLFRRDGLVGPSDSAFGIYKSAEFLPHEVPQPISSSSSKLCL